MTHASEPVSGTTVLPVMRWSMRIATLGLLGVGVVRLLIAPGVDSWRVSLGLGASAAFVVIYVTGVRRSERSPDDRRNRWWLASLTVLWVLLLVLNVEYTWLAFPLFFSHMALLRIRHALLAIVLILAVAMVVLVHDRGLSAGVLLGPTLGATIAVLVSWGYRALADESAQRLAAIDALHATRRELAERNREAGQLSERARLAREIHDTLAQGLSSIVLQSRNATAALDRFSDAASSDRSELQRARSLMQEAEHTASDNLTEARRFVRDLTPQALTSAGLVEAVQRHITTQQARFPETVWQFHLDGTPQRLNTDVEVVLLRAAQVATANAAQHAAATRVVCSLSFAGDQVMVDIVDDGRGFDVDADPGPESFGLRGLAERVASAGGTLSIESSPGTGTAISVAFGIPEETP